MKTWIARIASLFIAVTAFNVYPAEYGTVQEAEAMVKKAVAFYDKNGRDKTAAELQKSPGPFVDRDLYVTIYDMKGDCLAHINPKMVGKNLMDLRDSGGIYTVRDRVDAAKKGLQRLAGHHLLQPGHQEGRAQARLLGKARQPDLLGGRVQALLRPSPGRLR